MATFTRRSITGLAAAGAAVLLTAGPAAAHVHADPETVDAGAEASVAFLVGHGCDGLATDTVEIQVPEEVTEFDAGEVEGWTASVDGRVVRYEGGPLEDHDELGFPVEFTAPAEAMTLLFPTVQYCGDAESAWIAEDHDADNPAPVVEVVASGDTGTSAPDDTATTTEPVDGGAAPTTTEATGGGSEDGSADPEAGDAADDAAAEDDEDDDSSSVLPIVIGVVVVLALVGGGVAYARSRSGGNTSDGDTTE